MVYAVVYTFDMIRHITLKELRPKLPSVMSMIDKRMDRYIVTKRGKPVAVILSPDDYEGLIETLEIMSDPALMKRIKQAERDVKAGRTRSLEEIHRSLKVDL